MFNETYVSDILNYDKLVEILGDFKAPMGCRSFYQVGKREGHFEKNGRCNLECCYT